MTFFVLSNLPNDSQKKETFINSQYKIDYFASTYLGNIRSSFQLMLLIFQHVWTDTTEKSVPYHVLIHFLEKNAK